MWLVTFVCVCVCVCVTKKPSFTHLPVACLREKDAYCSLIYFIICHQRCLLDLLSRTESATLLIFLSIFKWLSSGGTFESLQQNPCLRLEIVTPTVCSKKHNKSQFQCDGSVLKLQYRTLCTVQFTDSAVLSAHRVCVLWNSCYVIQLCYTLIAMLMMIN